MEDTIELALDMNYTSDADEFEPPARRSRLIRERIEHLADLDKIDFVKMFRLTNRNALQVLDLINHRLEFATFDKNEAVSPINQVLLCLRFYATGCTQLSAFDFRGVSQPTAHRIVHQVIAAIPSLYKDNIHFPKNQIEIRRTQYEFYRIARFPRVIDAVDYVHQAKLDLLLTVVVCAKIHFFTVIYFPLGGDNAEYFRCRKGYFSINCQVIFNANLEIIDLVARWPGSAHDATIFDQCRQRALMEEEHYGDSILLGVLHICTCQKYLMVPLPNPSAAIPKEVSYNESQIRTRNPIERVLEYGREDSQSWLLESTQRLCRLSLTQVYYIPQPPDDERLELPMPWEKLILYG